MELKSCDRVYTYFRGVETRPESVSRLSKWKSLRVFQRLSRAQYVRRHFSPLLAQFPPRSIQLYSTPKQAHRISKFQSTISGALKHLRRIHLSLFPIDWVETTLASAQARNKFSVSLLKYSPLVFVQIGHPAASCTSAFLVLLLWH